MVSNLAVFRGASFTALKEEYRVDKINTDFLKALDRVSQKFLVSKLSSLRFHYTFLRWVTSYASNRLCTFAFDNVSSRSIIAISGVHKASIFCFLTFRFLP